MLPDAGTLRVLLAGFIAGMAAAFATSAIALIALTRDERWWAVRPAVAVPLPVLGVIFVNALMLAWTLLGLLLGAVYLSARSDDMGAALGSPHALFTAAIVVAVVALLLAGTYVRGRITWPMGATAAVAVASFGWLLPGLAR